MCHRVFEVEELFKCTQTNKNKSRNIEELVKWKIRNGKYHTAPVYSGYLLSNVNWMQVDLSRKSLNRASDEKKTG